MGAKKPAIAQSNIRSKIYLLAIIIGIIALFFVWQYLINKPNYRDLETEFEKISANIPSDWELVSTSGNKGTFGLFCWQIEGSECPHFTNTYLLDEIDSGAFEILNLLGEVLTESGYSVLDGSYGQKCSDKSLRDNDFLCYQTGARDKFNVIIKVSSYSSNGKASPSASISLGLNNE